MNEPTSTNGDTNEDPLAFLEPDTRIPLGIAHQLRRDEVLNGRRVLIVTGLVLLFLAGGKFVNLRMTASELNEEIQALGNKLTQEDRIAVASARKKLDEQSRIVWRIAIGCICIGLSCMVLATLVRGFPAIAIGSGIFLLVSLVVFMLIVSPVSLFSFWSVMLFGAFIALLDALRSALALHKQRLAESIAEA